MGLNGVNMILKELSILSVWCAALTLAAPSSLRAENKIPEDCKTGGFFMGCQAYTFNKFTVFEAIEKTAAAGGKVIEFYPGQTLSKDEPNVKWDHNASAETIQKVKAKLAASKVTAVNYGVVGIPKDEARGPQDLRVRQDHEPLRRHHRIRGVHRYHREDGQRV